MRDFPTQKVGDNYLHYSCQSIETKKLEKNNIEQIGDTFGIEPREVLKVPVKTLNKH